MADLDPAHLVDQAERHTWLIGVIVAATAWLLRTFLLGPRAELRELRSDVDRLSTGIDEVRVAQARMSDVHADQLAALTTRIDRAIDLMVGGAHTHRRAEDD